MKNFWQRLKKPFTVLAPMDNVTDMVFREIIALYLPPPDIYFTEFTSADGLLSKGKNETLRKLKFTNKQRPIVAQIWGTDPEKMKSAAQIVQDLKFDGVDINMGCPDRTVMKRGAGAAMCKTPGLVKEIIQAVKEGAPDIAISVKTRLGYEKDISHEWIPFLLGQNIDALTIHGRTAKQKSSGNANWEAISKAVVYRNDLAPNTLIIGNGDIKRYEQVVNMRESYQVDGVMIGRGIFEDPWIFQKNVNPTKHKKEEFIEILIKHINLFIDTWGESKNFEIMKKFLKMYVREFEGASELREKLMKVKSPQEIVRLLESEKIK